MADTIVARWSFQQRAQGLWQGCRQCGGLEGLILCGQVLHRVPSVLFSEKEEIRGFLIQCSILRVSNPQRIYDQCSNLGEILVTVSHLLLSLLYIKYISII